jgi:glyoxylase-like metal-dependent hydrolase (beta-lactamase superfamily II)
MLYWQVGDVRITRVLELDISLPPTEPMLQEATPEELKKYPWLHPNFVTAEGGMLFSVHALLVDAPGMRMVVDTCIGEGKPRKIFGDKAFESPFLKRLADAGWDRNEVDAVLCTHLHFDHVGWNTMLENGRWVPTFPKARYLFGESEFNHWTSHTDEAEQSAVMADSVQPIIDAGLVEFVQTDQRISKEVRLIPTPGHTPGHVSVVIESRGHTAVITGDMLHHPCQIARPAWSPPFDFDVKMSAATRTKLVTEWADAPVLVVGTHFPAPTAGYVVRDGDHFRLHSPPE